MVIFQNCLLFMSAVACTVSCVFISAMDQHKGLVFSPELSVSPNTKQKLYGAIRTKMGFKPGPTGSSLENKFIKIDRENQHTLIERAKNACTMKTIIDENNLNLLKVPKEKLLIDTPKKHLCLVADEMPHTDETLATLTPDHFKQLVTFAKAANYFDIGPRNVHVHNGTMSIIDTGKEGFDQSNQYRWKTGLNQWKTGIQNKITKVSSQKKFKDTLRDLSSKGTRVRRKLFEDTSAHQQVSDASTHLPLLSDITNNAPEVSIAPRRSMRANHADPAHLHKMIAVIDSLLHE